jgi:hypothetical protein
MEKTIRVFSGKAFSLEEMRTIRWTISTYPRLSRRELAATICESIGWLSQSSKPKLAQCMKFLAMLESEGAVKLPAKGKQGNRRAREDASATEAAGKTAEFRPDIVACGPVTLKIARRGSEYARWRKYVSEYHTLGMPGMYGAQLRYFVVSEGIELGCMLFSASSWALSEREEWIGWGSDDRKTRLHLIVNNSRFLIFPWVRVRNLASRALSLAARRIQEDWLKEYCYAPVLLETFVDTSRYAGTCYKAANWEYIGETKGRGRMDRHTERALSVKAIYMHPLQRDFREVLRGEKPAKAVTPEW